MYDITVKAGKLTVEKRPLILQAGSSTFVYAGEPQEFRQFFVDESTSLVGGHRLEVASASAILDVGTSPNVLTFTVRNSRGGDESRNYSIFVKEGTLTVTPRVVSIHTDSGSLVYDGTDQSYPYVTVENGVGDEYRAEGATTRRDVGSSENRMTVRFFRGDKDITSNYIIEAYRYGLLEITHRPLSVQLSNSEKIYDETPLKAGAFEINDNHYPLPKGHTLTLVAKGEVVFGTAPHRYVEDSARVTDERGQDVTKNYNISVTDGTLTVTPRPITLSSDNAVKVYDGKPLQQNQHRILSGSVLPNHRLSWSLTGVSITDVGTARNTFDHAKTRVTHKQTGEDVSMYYEISYSEGILEIQPRPITVTTPGGEWMYDAMGHRGDAVYEITEGNLLAGHTAEIASAESVIYNAGTLPNEVILRIMNDEWDVTHNYKITYRYGTLTVTKRPITVRAGSLTLTYDGKPHAVSTLTLAPNSPYPLATPRHELRVREGDQVIFTDVGSFLNDPTPSVYDTESGVYVTSNYEITRYEGVVTIEKRPLHVRLNGEKTYDGKPMDLSDYRVDFLNGTSPAAGHTVQAQPMEIHSGAAGTMESSIDRFSFAIKDPSGRDVQKNYDVTFHNGWLTVEPRPVSVITATAEKTYDGTPLVAYDVTIAPDSLPLAEGDEVFMVVSGSQTRVGQSKNTARPETLVIRDSLGQDATANYRLVSVIEGTLTVKHDVRITVTTGSAQKPYDGLPLTCGEYTVEVTRGTLPEGCSVYVTVTGLITRPGSTANSATVTIRDGEGNDVTPFFTVTLHTGVLTVTEELSQDAVFGRVYADRSGTVYLRMTSYGDYNGRGWEPATPYGSTLSGGYSPNLLPAAALKTLKLSSATTLRFSGMKITMLPYYTEIGGSAPVIGSDTDYTASGNETYTVSYYPVENALTLLEQFQQIPAYLRPYALGSYSSAEQTYRAFVEDHYLTLDAETETFMRSIIDKEGFSASDATVIGDVAAYIRTAARYDAGYDTALDSEDNVAIAFLRDYREGVCVHYATAATLLYRALGIPARYTTGFMMELEAGAWTEIRSPGHAWVEVYVDGLGWVQVEVTGSENDPDMPVDPPVTPPDSQKVELELIPAFTHKVYDGEYLYPKAELALTPTLEALLALGYTYDVEISGARREVGDSITVISGFTLYAPDGREANHLFRLVKRNGLLRVTPAAVEIFLYPVVKTYDGLPALWGEGDYRILSAPDGVTVSLSVTLPADRIGSLSLSELNRSAASFAELRVYRDGVDVSGDYAVIFTLPEGMEETPVLTVNPRPLELTAASETRVDNGEPLESPTVYLTRGSLAAGHRLEAVAVGRQEGIGTSANTVDTDSLRILDAEGRDVTHLYRVTTVDGVLSLVAEGGGS
jgi:F0F1-type ATP synthase epsilon subunit